MTLALDRATPAMGDLVDPTTDLRVIGTGFGFTEGPVWDRAAQVLRFSDIPGDTRFRWSEAAGVEVDLRPTSKGNGMVYDGQGDLLVCEHGTSSVVRFDATGRREVVADRYQGMELNSPNDVVTRSDGAIYFSDPSYGRMDHPHGVGRAPSPLGFQGVYRVGPGGGATELVVERHELAQPNGLCFSPDESILYVDDLAEIKAFDVASDGRLGRARVLHDGMAAPRSSEQPGIPDGMRCDERGNLWCAALGGIWVIDPEGGLLGIIRVSEVCANLVWGGPDWHTLYLTASTSVLAIRTLVGPAPLPYH